MRIIFAIFVLLVCASRIAYSDTITYSSTEIINGILSSVTTTILITPVSQSLRVTNTGAFRTTNTAANRTVSP